MSKAVIIGCSSGIGKALALLLSSQGYQLGLAGRNVSLMAEVKEQTRNSSHLIQFLDLTQTEESIKSIQFLFEKMGEVDLVIINSGVGYANPELDWLTEKHIIDVNVLGFVSMAAWIFKYFQKRGKGHMVGISSIAGIRGAWHVPSYNASKSFVSNYLEGLRCKALYLKLPIIVTDIRPGFVLTPMIEGRKDLFWAATAEKAAHQIYCAIQKKKNCVYVTRRWRLIGWVLKWIPEWIYFPFMLRAKRA